MLAMAVMERLQTQLARQTAAHHKTAARLLRELARRTAEYQGVVNSIRRRATAPIQFLLGRSPWIIRQAQRVFRIITTTQLHKAFLRAGLWRSPDQQGSEHRLAEGEKAATQAKDWPAFAGSAEIIAHTLQNTQGPSTSSPPLHDYFDKPFYLHQNPGLAEMSLEALQHYLNHGWKAGRSPHPLFNVKWYLEHNPDVLAAGVEPLQHYLDYGWKEGRSPHPMFNAKWYLEDNPDVLAAGVEPLQHYLQHGYNEERNPHPTFNISRYHQENPDVKQAGIEPLTHYFLSQGNDVRSSKFELFSDTDDSAGPLRHPYPVPLRIFSASKKQRRVNLLTDTISHQGLIGGLGTAIIFSILLAKRWNCPLRVITRKEKPEAGKVKGVLLANNISWENNIEFLFAHIDDERAHVDLSREDVFITTSWQTTLSAVQSLRSDRIVYLLQEDERLLCSGRDEKLRCQEAISNPEINILVNSYLLYQQLVNDGFGSVKERRLWFEPSDQILRDWRASFAEAINYLSQKMQAKH
jgi:hypothetical protein